MKKWVTTATENRRTIQRSRKELRLSQASKCPEEPWPHCPGWSGTGQSDLGPLTRPWFTDSVLVRLLSCLLPQSCWGTYLQAGPGGPGVLLASHPGTASALHCGVSMGTTDLLQSDQV